MAARHALVIGASGSAGWAVVDEISKGYGNFSSVTALVNRPLALETAVWKADSDIDLQIVSGMDLTRGSADDIAAFLRANVAHVAKVTQVFWCAFKQEDEPAEEYRVNGEMMRRLTGALNEECPDLSMFVVCAGARFYLRQCSPEKPLPAPFREEMVEWADEETRSGVFYYAWDKVLAGASKRRKWSWCDIVPDAIVGFAPSGSTFALPIMWATWLSCYRLKEGAGATVPYPGNMISYKTKFNASSAAQIAHEMVWAGLNPAKSAGGQVFNVADSDKPSSMEVLFPKLAKYFGLKGVPPPENIDGMTFPSEYVVAHGHLLDEFGCKKASILKAPWLDAYGTVFTYNRHLSLEKVREAGFDEEREPINGWFEVFDRMKDANMIPR